MTETAGVDFSDTKPDPIALVRGGFRFVVGYLKPLLAPGKPNPKELTANYIRRARAAGLAVAAVFETTTGRALSGADGGKADGATARARAAAIGYPTSAVCFAAVDTDVTSAQFPTIVAYLEAFAAAWGGPAGGYGELDLIEHLADVAPALYRWQTEAWSGHRLSPHAHLFQRSTPSGHWPVVSGTDEDVLCAPIPWHGPIAPAPRPDPSPAPAPAPVPDPEVDMLLVSVPSHGIWSLDGIGYHHIAEPATVAALKAAGVKNVTISEAEHAGWVADQGKLRGGTPAGS